MTPVQFRGVDRGIKGDHKPKIRHCLGQSRDLGLWITCGSHRQMMIKFLFLLACSSVIGAQRVLIAPRVEYADNSVPTPYEFSYEAPADGGSSSHQQTGDGYGRVTGSYSVQDDDGRQRIVDYVADEGGFRASISTNEPGTANQNPADVQIASSADDGVSDAPALQAAPEVIPAAPVLPVAIAPRPLVRVPIRRQQLVPIRPTLVPIRPNLVPVQPEYIPRRYLVPQPLFPLDAGRLISRPALLPFSSRRYIDDPAIFPVDNPRLVPVDSPRLVPVDSPRLVPVDSPRYIPVDNRRLVSVDNTRLIPVDNTRVFPDPFFSGLGRDFLFQ